LYCTFAHKGLQEAHKSVVGLVEFKKEMIGIIKIKAHQVNDEPYIKTAGFIPSQRN